MKSELQNTLNSNIPEQFVEQREAWKNGPKLSYLSGAYVINRLNEVLGQGNWGYQIKSMIKVHEGVIQQSGVESFTTSYVTTISFGANIDGKIASFEDVGYGDGTDKKSAGKAHELAVKEAVTDGIKRCAKNLGISMGLGLYFKSGEYVDEEVVVKPAKAVTQAPAAAPKQEVKAPAQATAKTATDSVADSSNPSAKPSDTKIPRQTLKSYFSVLRAKNAINQLDFAVNYLGSDKGKAEKLDAVNLGKAVDLKIESLTESEISATLGKVRADFKQQLGLN